MADEEASLLLRVEERGVVVMAVVLVVEGVGEEVLLLHKVRQSRGK